MNGTRVRFLRIKRFRRFEDIEIPFGKHITIIAGQNGTSKSTLLGMLAQPFSFGVVRGRTAKTADQSSYTRTYHGLKLHEYVDLSGKPFMYDCDNVFRLSRAFDFGKDYEYEVRLEFPSGAGITLPNDSLLTKSRARKTKGRITGMRFVTGPGTSHESGEGNFPHPVLYLGLNRLWPLANTRRCKFPADSLSVEDRKWYVEKYSEILCLAERDNSAKFMDTAEKRRFITPESSTYDGESCSAGQDNLSQILTAVLSFRALKTKLGSRYQGGILLIDELDATLHAFAQPKLLDLLCRASEDLWLQIVATSHSLCLLQHAFERRRGEVHVLHLANEDGAAILKESSSFQQVSDHLRLEVTPTLKKPAKVPVLFEDREGECLFQQICGSKLRQYIQCASTSSLSAGHLKHLANLAKAVPALSDAILLPDGDMAQEWRSPPKNLLALPGAHRPETLIYQHLFNMREADPFWKKCGPTYSKQFAITKAAGHTLEKGDDKKWVKGWYREQSPHWGYTKRHAFESWTHAHKKECSAFCRRFVRLLRERYKGAIPDAVISRVLAEFE